jgi:hypothetical protein
MKKIYTNLLISDFNNACDKGDIKYVKYLFNSHSGILLTDFSYGIQIATRENNDKIVKLFLNINKTKNFIIVEDLNYALYYTIKNLNYDLFELILNQNICDLNYKPAFLNFILKILNFSDDDEKIKLKKQKIIKKLFNYKTFLTSVIENVKPIYISYYIKKYIFYNDLIDFNSTLNAQALLYKLIINILIINNIKFLNDILYKYEFINEYIKKNISYCIVVSVLNNSVDVLEKILTLNNIELNSTILYSIDYKLSKPNHTNIQESFKILLDDGRIFNIIQTHINRLGYNILSEIMKYLNVENKTELMNVFNFL